MTFLLITFSLRAAVSCPGSAPPAGFLLTAHTAGFGRRRIPLRPMKILSVYYPGYLKTFKQSFNRFSIFIISQKALLSTKKCIKPPYRAESARYGGFLSFPLFLRIYQAAWPSGISGRKIRLRYAGHIRYRHRLQPYFSRTRNDRIEQSLSAQQLVFQARERFGCRCCSRLSSQPDVPVSTINCSPFCSSYSTT